MSEDKLQQRNAILYYIQQGVEGEKFLLAQHDSIPYDRKYKLYYALGFIGGQESVCFLGRNTKARTGSTIGNLLDRGIDPNAIGE